MREGKVYKKYGKRILDVSFSAVGLILLSPLLLLVASILGIMFKGSPFFLQKRPGLKTNLFYIIKFRTMTSERSGTGELLPDSHRKTNIGSLIRMASIDEIPQLWNVIKGEMSLVGPRPLLPEDLLLCNPHQRQRHNVRPGITGWAQVNGRNSIDLRQKCEYDIWYIQNISLRLDLIIFCKTLSRVFSKETTANFVST